MIYLLLLTLSTAFAQSQPEAIKCVEKFLTKMSTIKGYSANIKKREFYDGEWNEEPIGLKSDGKTIEYTFLDKGTTGVKNSGMMLTFDGSDTLKIKWGEARGFGVLGLKAAQAVIGDTLPLTSDTSLEGEMFTLNRAGFTHIAYCLKHHLKAIKEAKTGGLYRNGVTGCHLKYTPPEVKYTSVHLTKDMSIADLEAQHGDFAFHIRQANPDHFADLDELFNRDADHDIRVPDFLLPFEVDIGANDLPEKFVMYVEGQKVGEYTFTDVKSW